MQMPSINFWHIVRSLFVHKHYIHFENLIVLQYWKSTVENTCSCYEVKFSQVKSVYKQNKTKRLCIVVQDLSKTSDLESREGWQFFASLTAAATPPPPPHPTFAQTWCFDMISKNTVIKKSFPFSICLMQEMSLCFNKRYYSRKSKLMGSKNTKRTLPV